MDDNRQFMLALTLGYIASGMVFWLAFWHGRVLLAVAWGLMAFVLCWFRYGGPQQWNKVLRNGTRHEILRFKAIVVFMALLLTAFCIVLAMKGQLPGT